MPKARPQSTAMPEGRPSFAEFWQVNQRAETAAEPRDLTFVVSDFQGRSDEEAGGGGGPAQSSSSGAESGPPPKKRGGAQRGGQGQGQAKNNKTNTKAKDNKDKDADLDYKAQRRAQVRRAQLQHRARKAEYTRQLEEDIARLRGDVERTHGHTRSLAAENDAMRRRLAAAGVHLPGGGGAGGWETGEAADYSSEQPGSVDMAGQHGGVDDGLGDAVMSDAGSFVPVPAPPTQYTVSINVDQSVRAPSLQVARSASGEGVDGLTDEQTDMVINWILALEHICWDHVHYSCTVEENCGSTPPGADGNGDGDASAGSERSASPAWGHELMATTLAMQSAPPEVLAQIDTASRARKAHGQQQQQQAPATVASPSPTGGGTDNSPPSPSSSPPPVISWSSANVSLQKLFELAQVLNPPDAELAPVQAWFELARLHGLAAALDPPLLARVCHGLGAAVDCPVFGAVIARPAFDAVVAAAVAQWSPGLPAGWDPAAYEFGSWADDEQVFWAKARAAPWGKGGKEVHGVSGAGKVGGEHDDDNDDDDDAAARSVRTRVKRRFLQFFSRRSSSVKV